MCYHLSYSPWNILLSHLKGEWMMSARWANGAWAHPEWTVSPGCRCSLMIGKWCASAERKQSAKWMVNDMWTLCERKMNNLFRVSRELSLHCVSSVMKIKITKKTSSMYFYQPKCNNIRLNNKCMLNERWVQGELFVNTGDQVKAPWAWTERRGERKWTHYEHTKKWDSWTFCICIMGL